MADSSFEHLAWNEKRIDSLSETDHRWDRRVAHQHGQSSRDRAELARKHQPGLRFCECHRPDIDNRLPRPVGCEGCGNVDRVLHSFSRAAFITGLGTNETVVVDPGFPICLTTTGAAFGDRASVRKIVERVRYQQLEELRQRINPFKLRYTDLSPQESEQLQGLLALHNTIRDTPTTSTTHTLWRAAVGLIVPTLVFAITVFGEVSAERLLDSILP